MLSASLISCLGLLTCLLPGCTGNESKEDIVLGQYASLTGKDAIMGQMTNKGVQLAVNDLNATGGLLGRRVRLLTLDDKSQMISVAADFENLLSHHCVTVISESVSGRVLDAAERANKKGVPLLCASATNPRITQNKDDPQNGLPKSWVFRVCFTDTDQARAIAWYIMTGLVRRSKERKVLALYSATGEDALYSHGLAAAVGKALGRDAKMTYVPLDKQGSAGKRLSEELKKRPTVVVLPLYGALASRYVHQLRVLNYRGPIVGGDTWDQPIIRAGNRKWFRNTFFTSHVWLSDNDSDKSNNVRNGRIKKDDGKDDKVQTARLRFKSRYFEWYHSYPNSFSAIGYDTVNVWADAVRRAKIAERDAIRAALDGEELRKKARSDDPNARLNEGVIGVTGTIRIDPLTHSAQKAIPVIGMSEKGEWNVVATWSK